MRITALVPTHHLPEESMAWMTEARNIFDEVIVLIDQKRATPGTVARAEKVATSVVRNNRDNWYDPDPFPLLAGCNGDWVFILDYDEQLSSEWQQDVWRQILETTNLTHFWCPRRWIVAGQQYIRAEPWWPDFQLRLFRNNLKGTTFPTKLHDTIYVPGLSACFRNLAIHHHVLWLCSRATRENRIRYYEQLRPGGALGHYYLYEDYRPPEASLPKPRTLNIDKEVCSMDKLKPADAAKLSLTVTGVPEALRTSEMFWLDAEVTNATSKLVCACPPFPVRLSYHWLHKRTGQMAIFDGNRSGLFPGLPANASMKYPMSILVPKEPGQYILQITMVQENVRWFESIRPEILQEFVVSVTA
jgi:hypothetical protein